MAEAPPIRVLLIEDDDDVRASTEQALSLAGFEVTAFANAERVRPLIAFGLPAIVVCDVRLPGMSGVEWLPEIRKIDPEAKIKRGTCLKDRPVLTVMRSAPDGQNMLMQLLNSGCEGYADITREIEKLFIDWTEITPWLAPAKK